MAKTIFVANLEKDARIEEVFLISSKTVGSARTGAPFIKLKLCDKTGEVDAVKWDVSKDEMAAAAVNSYCKCSGMVSEYKDAMQITIQSLRAWNGEIDPADFIPCSDHDCDEMLADLMGFVQSVRNPNLSALLDHFFGDDAFVKRFSKAPAAYRMHHAFISGLLEHTLGVCRLCASMSSLYADIDGDLLMTGAVLHDVGKIDEFVWDKAISYSDEGNLIGHIVGGAMMIRDASASIRSFDNNLGLSLQHMILSHHGLLEYGSPQLPKSMEAMALHYADDIDAKLFQFRKAIKDSDEKNEPGVFTSRVFGLDRAVFKGFPEEPTTERVIPEGLFAEI